TEGSTATILPEDGITTGVTVEQPAQLFVRGSILRAKITDMKSPITYGYESADLPVYFNQSPVLNASAGGGFGGFGGGRGGAPGTNPNGGVGQNVTPNALPLRIQPLEGDANPVPAGRGGRPGADDTAQLRQMAQQFGVTIDDTPPRAAMQFSRNANALLLSRTLLNGQPLPHRRAAPAPP